ncbi:MAG: alpha/beta hydrolase [Chitinophagales bacterium]|nr:alpha/beta hydrolase [Chitinophagales bacterium]
MIKYFLITTSITLLFNCKNASDADGINSKDNSIHAYNIYSKEVGDTFSISVYHPQMSATNQHAQLPVVYVLDANLYFDMVVSMCKGYEKVGLLPPMIVVGIGYRDIYAMDSLRNRDYTFPEAIPIYEMIVSGRAMQFQSFIQSELIPEIDKKFKTDAGTRILAGHSLGGYFTLFALHQNLEAGKNTFSHYIAASPSLHYNHYYITEQFGKIKRNEEVSGNLFLSYGGQEDFNDGEPSMIASKVLFERIEKSIDVDGRDDCEVNAFSNLNHMQTAMPTFMKGLEKAFAGPPIERE